MTGGGVQPAADEGAELHGSNSPTDSSVQPSDDGAPAVDSSNADSMLAEMLAAEVQCAVCCQIMHRPVAMAPCMHKICKSCYVALQLSGYKRRCAICRTPTTEVADDHTVQNIIDRLQKRYPGYARDPADTAAMDQKVAAFERSLQSSPRVQSEYATASGSVDTEPAGPGTAIWREVNQRWLTERADANNRLLDERAKCQRDSERAKALLRYLENCRAAFFHANGAAPAS